MGTRVTTTTTAAAGADAPAPGQGCIYIMSRPHSGSTILDIMLSGGDRVAGCGEIVMGMDKDPATWRCSCGRVLPECPEWGRVIADLEAGGVAWRDLAAETVAQAHKGSLWRTWRARAPEGGVGGGGGSDPGLERLAASTRALFAAIRAATGKSHVLDSSKVPARGLFLAKYLPEACLVHIVRHPLSSVASYYWRLKIGDTYLAQKRPYHGPLRPLAYVEAAAMWLAGNLVYELIARANPSRAIRIRYENLCARPQGELDRLGATLGVPVGGVAERVAGNDAFSTGHMLGGNPVRHEGKVAFDPTRQARREVPPLYVRLIVLAICWPLMLRYGYLASPAATASRLAAAGGGTGAGAAGAGPGQASRG